MSTEQTITWLTQEAHDRLSAELTDLTENARPEVVKKIEQARSEGDLKENGGYHAAKEEQGKIEARIRQLKVLLENARVGSTDVEDGLVGTGMVVEARIAGEKLSFLLGSREVAGESDLEVYSEKSPIGEAIMGQKVGKTVSYAAPNGKNISVEILSATPYRG